MPEPLPRSTIVSPGLTREVEVVAHAGEGVDRGSRDGVELGDGVAESDREWTAGLEVELLVRLLGDLAVHLFDPLFELMRVEFFFQVRYSASQRLFQNPYFLPPSNSQKNIAHNLIFT